MSSNHRDLIGLFEAKINVIIIQFRRQLCWLFFVLTIFSQGSQAFGKTQITESELSSDTAIFLSLWKQAQKLKIYNHPYWLKLLHFYSVGETVGQWSFKSDILSPSFFLSQLGKTDPNQE